MEIQADKVHPSAHLKLLKCFRCQAARK